MQKPPHVLAYVNLFCFLALFIIAQTPPAPTLHSVPLRAGAIKMNFELCQPHTANSVITHAWLLLIIKAPGRQSIDIEASKPT